MSGYISLSRNRTHKKEETIKLNLPSNFMESFYKDFLDGINLSQDNDFQQFVNSLLSEYVKIFLVDFGEEIQVEVVRYVGNNRLNEASFRRRLTQFQKTL